MARRADVQRRETWEFRKVPLDTSSILDATKVTSKTLAHGFYVEDPLFVVWDLYFCEFAISIGIYPLMPKVVEMAVGKLLASQILGHHFLEPPGRQCTHMGVTVQNENAKCFYLWYTLPSYFCDIRRRKNVCHLVHRALMREYIFTSWY